MHAFISILDPLDHVVGLGLVIQIWITKKNKMVNLLYKLKSICVETSKDKLHITFYCINTNEIQSDAKT